MPQIPSNLELGFGRNRQLIGSTMSSDEDDGKLDGDMFREPDDYFEPEKPATYTEHTLLSGQKLRLRLVGHNPLWVPAHMFSSILGLFD